MRARMGAQDRRCPAVPQVQERVLECAKEKVTKGENLVREIQTRAEIYSMEISKRNDLVKPRLGQCLQIIACQSEKNLRISF